MLGNKLVSALLYIFLKLVSVCGSLKDLAEYLEGDLLVDTVLFSIKVNISRDIDHAVADDLGCSLNHADSSLAALVGVVLLGFNIYESVLNACLLDLASLVV